MRNINPNSLKNLVHGFKKGMTPWNKGKKGLVPAWNKGTSIKLNDSFDKWNIKHKGEKHYKWKIDRTQVKIGERSLNDPLQKGWRKAVKNRDGWKCRIANSECKGRLEAHHILAWKDFPELRYEVNNGITLCHHHHPRKKEDVVKLSPYFQKLVASLD